MSSSQMLREKATESTAGKAVSEATASTGTTGLRVMVNMGLELFSCKIDA